MNQSDKSAVNRRKILGWLMAWKDPDVWHIAQGVALSENTVRVHLRALHQAGQAEYARRRSADAPYVNRHQLRAAGIIEYQRLSEYVVAMEAVGRV